MENKFLGSIKDKNNSIVNIFVNYEDKNFIKFYDENNNLIAIIKPPYDLIISEEYREKAPEYLKQIDSLWNDIARNAMSIDNTFNEREKFSKALGIDNKKIISTNSIGLSQKLDKKPQNKIVLDDNENKEQNKSVLDSISYREETKMNKLVNDRYTLGEILGIDDPNATLICVHSSDISGERSDSQFSFLIKYQDGRVEEANMLTQEDGIHPSREIYASDRDGSSINKVDAVSMYRIKTPNGKDSMLCVSYGQTGTLNFHYGKVDRTDVNKFFAIPLETNTSRYITKDVQDIFDPERGEWQTSKSIEEVEKHKEHGCNDLTLDEADGNENTGHDHNIHFTLIASKILNENPELEDYYSLEGLTTQLQEYIEHHNDIPLEQAIEDFTKDTLEDCYHFRNIKK